MCGEFGGLWRNGLRPLDLRKMVTGGRAALSMQGVKKVIDRWSTLRECFFSPREGQLLRLCFFDRARALFTQFCPSMNACTLVLKITVIKSLGTVRQMNKKQSFSKLLSTPINTFDDQYH